MLSRNVYAAGFLGDIVDTFTGDSVDTFTGDSGDSFTDDSSDSFTGGKSSRSSSLSSVLFTTAATRCYVIKIIICQHRFFYDGDEV